jgi:hypothetical protein
MAEIYNAKGEKVADLSLSDRQADELDEGRDVVVMWHTPRQLHGLYPLESGHFTLRKDGERTVVIDAPDAVSRVALYQDALKAKAN